MKTPLCLSAYNKRCPRYRPLCEQVAAALVGGYAVYEQQQQQQHAAQPLKATQFDTEEAGRINKGIKSELLPVPAKKSP